MKPFTRGARGAIFVVALFSAVLAGCGNRGRQQEDVVRIAFSVEPSSLNPLLAISQAETIVNQAIYSGLLRFDDSGKLLADAASRVPTVSDGISADGRTITYHLRPNVFWHDGTRLTAADVAFTFARIKDRSVNVSFGARYANVDSVVAKDASTVEVHLSRPFVDTLQWVFVAGRNGGLILPKHLLEHHSHLNQDPFNGKPVGSGPYAVESWSRGNALVLVANQRYFGGVPKVRHLRLDFVPNATTAFARIQTGEDDIADVPADLARKMTGTNVTIERHPGHLLAYLTLNLRSPQLRDVRVRRALAAAVERTGIARTVYLGDAQPAYGMIPLADAAPFGLPQPQQRPDLALAKRLLAAQGWNERRPLSLVLVTISGASPLQAIAVQLQQTWRPLGIDLHVKPLVASHLFAADGPLAKGQFDIALGGFAFTDSSPDRRSLLTPAFFPPGGYNRAHYDDAVVTADEIAAEETRDRRLRSRLYAEVEARVSADVPYIPLVWPNATYATNRRVVGFRPGTFGSYFWNVQDWRLQRATR